MITAKCTVNSRTESGVGDQRQVAVNLAADYADGRNKEWSLYTPSLSLAITLRGDVADQFPVGAKFELRFVDESEESVARIS